MVNRVLTSPYLWWFDPFPAAPKHDRRPQECWHDPYGHDCFIPRAAGLRKSGKRTLAIRAAHRTTGPVSARQAIDNAIIRRAAASGPGIRRSGAGAAYRRFRPLSDRQGDRAVPAGGSELAFHPIL